MGRREGREHGRFDEAISAAEACLNTPFNAIGANLKEMLTAVQAAASAGEVTRENSAQVAQAALDTIRRLPKAQGKRFWFDALMLQAMAKDWSPRPLFSPMLLPNYDEHWGHARVTPPVLSQTVNGTRFAHVIDMIFFPGSDNIDEVDLLDYPWAAHELAHNLMLRHDEFFVPAIVEAVNRRIKSLRLAAIADQGSARSKAHAFIDEFASFWSPTADQRNWSHEISADIIALHVLGPAYLAVFEDLLESLQAPNPYHISQHPPYAARTLALVQAGQLLGWSTYLTRLQAVTNRWPLTWQEQRSNRFVGLADTELVSSIVRAVLGGCHALGLNACTPSRLSDVEHHYLNIQEIEAGTELIIAAWLTFIRARHNFANWERGVVTALSGSITQ